MLSFAFPGDIEQDIREITSLEIPYMRTAEFSDVVFDIQSRLLEMIGCVGGRLIPFTASGTGGMDAIVTNYVLPLVNRSGCPAMVINGGSFGRRWRDLCRYYSCPEVTLDIPFGRDIDYANLETRMREVKPSALLIHHHETSSGQIFDIERVGRICRQGGVSLVVDAISSFLSEPLDMAAMNIDLCLTSSQKGLNIQPGLALVFIAPRLLNFDWGHNSFYFDFHENLHNLTRGQTPFSPATMLFLQLQARLHRLEQEGGVDENIRRVAQRAMEFRDALDKLGVEMPVENKANCVTGFRVDTQTAKTLFRDLIDRGIFIMPGGDPTFFRVSHLGVSSALPVAEALKELLNTPKS